jgi:hypothetical protein
MSFRRIVVLASFVLAGIGLPLAAAAQPPGTFRWRSCSLRREFPS